MQRKYHRSVKKSNKLKKWLDKKNITSRVFADMLHCNYYSIRRYINEERPPSLQKAIEIERLTDGEVPCVSWYDLTTREPANNSPKK